MKSAIKIILGVSKITKIPFEEITQMLSDYGVCDGFGFLTEEYLTE